MALLRALAVILLFFWVLSLAFKVTVGAIHLLLVAAIVLFAISFFRRHAPRAAP